VDTNAILSKLEKAAPGKVLESNRFGRSELLSVWVESSAVHDVAKAVNNEPSLKLQWLENLSFAEVGDSLVISWFLRSRETQVQLVIRSSVVVESEREPVDVVTVRDIWPMAAPIENEAAELFGIRFKKASGEVIEIPRVLLTEEQASESKFPMRKSYPIGSGQMGARSK
jgi:NADH:ubiquinone oxidoreductase subunit C